MLTKSDAIVLHSFKYGESRIIVDVFSRESGRLSLIASMPKTQKGRLKKQFFQPMTILSLEYDHRQQVQLQSLKDARLLLPWRTMTSCPEKLSQAIFVAEFLYYALRSEQRNELLYDYVTGAMEWLDTAEGSYANFHLAFLMRLSRFLGFYPNLHDEAASSGVMFDLREGRFCAVAPTHRDFLGSEEASLIRLMMRMDFANMHLFRLSHHDRNRILDVLLTYYRLHIPQFPELKSLDVLKELWG